jgi:5-methylcytosine-specific restriction endonuclease McrA
VSAHLREAWASQVTGVSIPALPDKGMFTRGRVNLDPRIFTPEERLRPDLRAAIIETLDGFWGPLYGNWQRWARVYIAGSAASYWYDSDTDLDILIGVDMGELRRQRPQNIGVSEADVCAHLDHELKTALDPLTTDFRGTGMIATFFVNPGSYDIRVIKPYAAYDVTNNEWAVHPPVLPEDWSAKHFPMEWWRRAATVAARITEILSQVEPERTEVGVALFDSLHELRQRAYSPLGLGWTDWGNFLWQVLSQWRLLQPLYKLKHPELATISMSFAREGVKTARLANDDEWDRATKAGRSKIRNAPSPTDADRIHHDQMVQRQRGSRAGGDGRGNNLDRRRREQRLLSEFGDGKHAPCLHCRTMLNADTITADRIHPGHTGGSYRYHNVIPACEPCNASRPDVKMKQTDIGRRARAQVT